MRMDGAAFQEKTGKKPAVLIFTFTQSVGLNIRSPFDIEIPVPQGLEQTACKIVQDMFSPIPTKSLFELTVREKQR
jgi:hypothetical protein